MAIDWEWVISIHPTGECGDVDVCEFQTVDEVNSLLEKIDDPVEVSICRCNWTEDRGMYDRDHFYVNFETMQFETMQFDGATTVKIPQKYRKELLRLQKPKVIYTSSMCPCCNENS